VNSVSWIEDDFISDKTNNDYSTLAVVSVLVIGFGIYEYRKHN
jgi:hypothetical protein